MTEPPASLRCSCGRPLTLLKLSDSITPAKICAAACDAPDKYSTLSSMGFYDVEGHDA